jgi:hypothetical protein
MSRLTLYSASVLLALGSTAALAMPVPQPGVPPIDPSIVHVYGGCGPYGHRGPAGYCRTGGQAGGYIPGYSCPAAFHIGPYGRHCWPN